jgi:hypothetical protein
MYLNLMAITRLSAMDLSEDPLLNAPALMLIVLRAAERSEATLRDCLARLHDMLAEAHESPPVADGELIDELANARDQLLAAHLIVATAGGAFAVTRRGREVLTANPLGIDDTVLIQFPEYRAFIRRSVDHPLHDDPRLGRYEEGYAAYRPDGDPADNPYQPDTIDHLAWENGWSEARDEALSWMPPHRA